jgi:hypothetical protein
VLVVGKIEEYIPGEAYLGIDRKQGRKGNRRELHCDGVMIPVGLGVDEASDRSEYGL